MSATPPKLDSGHGLQAWMPSRKALLIVVAAFAIGLLLFLALWFKQRGQNDFYRADSAPQSIEGRQFEPLPTPLPADRSASSNASGLDETADKPEPRQAQQDAAPPPPAESAAPPLPAPAPVPAPAAIASQPEAIRAPAPRYPRSAQRRRESGTVLLRAHVAADGGVVAVDLVQSSGSRDLDRAASEAVRRWQFRPAIAAGRPVAAEVQIPISFNLGQ